MTASTPKRRCSRCDVQFDPIERLPNQKVCAHCALDAMDQMFLEMDLKELEEMTPEEVHQELLKDGFTEEELTAFKSKTLKMVEEMLAKRKEHDATRKDGLP